MRGQRGALTAIALLCALLAGVWLGGNPGHLPETVRSVLVNDAGALSAEAAELIESNYFRQVEGENLKDGSIAGMVRRVSRQHEDRFSHYFDPEAMERFDEAISGSFSGVGLSVVEVRRGLRVGRVFSGTPADEAGIEEGDVIVSVDGRSIAGANAEAVVTEIKGPEGTEVTLGVHSPGDERPREIEITRREINVPPTRTAIREAGGLDLGYLQFATFSREAHGYVRRSVERLRDNGADGILLDLRGNGGGLLSEAILTASVFLEEGEVVVTTRSRSEGDREYEALGGRVEPGPMVVLIDRNTASAGEILAAALHESLDAPLVGTPTFGKGVFQKVLNLSNGGALDLTIGEYYTSEGVSLAGDGLPPDHRVEGGDPDGPDVVLRRGLQVLAAEISQEAEAAS